MNGSSGVHTPVRGLRLAENHYFSIPELPKLFSCGMFTKQTIG